MEPLSFLANLLLTVTVGTLIVALAAYMAYKVREMRKPQRIATASKTDAPDEMVFLRPYIMPPLQRASHQNSEAPYQL